MHVGEDICSPLESPLHRSTLDSDIGIRGGSPSNVAARFALSVSSASAQSNLRDERCLDAPRRRAAPRGLPGVADFEGRGLRCRETAPSRDELHARFRLHECRNRNRASQGCERNLGIAMPLSGVDRRTESEQRGHDSSRLRCWRAAPTTAAHDVSSELDQHPGDRQQRKQRSSGSKTRRVMVLMPGAVESIVVAVRRVDHFDEQRQPALAIGERAIGAQVEARIRGQPEAVALRAQQVAVGILRR